MEGVIGYTTMFAGNFAPKSWAFCQGQLIAISSNTALFSILGTTYGGDGKATFGLPNLINRQVVGAGQRPGLSNYALGEATGTNTVTINSLQMPAHVHPVQVNTTMKFNTVAGASTPGNGYYASTDGSTTPFTEAPSTSLKPYQGTIQMTPSGGNQPFTNQNPVMALNYIICMFGVYPARN